MHGSFFFFFLHCFWPLRAGTYFNGQMEVCHWVEIARWKSAIGLK
jgi:hypothetical protein